MPKMQIVATYRRVSTKEQGTNFSLATQKQKIDTFLACQDGWVYPEGLDFQDIDSGEKRNLPGLDAMLGAAERGEFTVLVVAWQDRLARRTSKASLIRDDLDDLGIAFKDASDPHASRFMYDIKGAVAANDNDVRRIRTIDGRKQKAREGKVVGQNRPPYGYKYDHEPVGNTMRIYALVPDPDTAAIAEEILNRLPTESATAIAADLTGRGVPSPFGTRWNHHTIGKMGRARVYTGVYEYGRQQSKRTDAYAPIPVQVPAMIDEAQHQTIVRALQERRTTHGGRVQRIDGQPVLDPYILRGMLRCQTCGGPLKTAVRRRTTRLYQCGNRRQNKCRDCVLPDVPAELVEAELVAILRSTLLNPDALDEAMETWAANQAARRATWQDRRAKIEQKITVERRRLDDVVDKFIEAGSGELMRRLRSKAEEIEAAIDHLAAELRREAPTPVGVPTISMDEIRGEWASELAWDLLYPAEVRRIAQGLHVRGDVALGSADDADSVALGRHPYRIDWTADLPLRVPAGNELLNLLRSSDGVV